ncbi:hypothetical protein PX554_26130 [Sphingomonas sp. H39-1-10]|uniref:hypothetical protein n=1 Tax=Sphingomonas pollutisoli TaxID=3030829 RepID=UPI0023B983CA|nr:hypothetical protein [Sphingomonas pollutisoli]MDF0491597.1 hypothetical protein [Sphingomonas pollutisoli]
MTPLSIPEALARRDAAQTARDMAHVTRDLAADHAKAADDRVAEIAAIEERATGDFIERIRNAAARGLNVERDKPSADAIARSSAEAEARSAHAALQTLTRERDDADAALDAAELDLRIATNAACNEHATTILEAMEAAYQTLSAGAMHLGFLGRVAFTPLPQPEGPLPPGSAGTPPLGLKLNPRAQMLARLVGDGASKRSQDQERQYVEMWQMWRAALVDDPATPSPWDMRE